MENTLTFKTENERKGAEIIIENAIRRTSLKWYSKSNPDVLSVKYENVPDALFRMVESHPDWPLIDLVGRSDKLREISDGMEKRFDEADDKIAEAKAIIGEVQEIISIKI